MLDFEAGGSSICEEREGAGGYSAYRFSSRSSKQRRALERTAGLEVLLAKCCGLDFEPPPWSLSLLLGLPGVRCYLTVLSYLH